jgi:hypothetical protein
VVPRFVKNDAKRKWQTAIDLLNEAVAYSYFVSLGCSEVHFVSETTMKTPDLRFKFGSVEFSCEVKTFNRSEESVSSDGAMQVFKIEDRLAKNFLEGKFMNTINTNLPKFDGFKNTKKLYFFVMNFDDQFHEYADRYFKQIEQWLDEKSVQVDGLICLDNSMLWRDEPLVLEWPKGLWKRPEA